MTATEPSYPLHWEVEGPIGFAQHHAGTSDLAFLFHQGEVRNALQTWASVETADIGFEEEAIYTGPACPHGLGGVAADVCDFAHDPDDGPVDGISALFFIETSWPYGEEVIALTTVSYGPEGQVLDADIAFNGLDYRWSVGDEGVRTDLQSIVLHEVGHFLGLDHTEVAGAVMVVDYEEGMIRRDLGQDDIDGIASLYPCASPPCRGDVSYPEPRGCAYELAEGGGQIGRLGGGSAPGLFVLVGLAMVLLWRSGRRRIQAPVLLLALLLGPPAETSTVAVLSIDDLALRADAVVEGRIQRLVPQVQGIVWTEVELEVERWWAGENPGSSDSVLRWTQPGGWSGEWGTKVFGMPEFGEGDRVVLFLDGLTEGHPRILGLAQGAFFVQDDGRVERDLSGLAFARVGGHRPPEPVEAPDRLDALLGRVQAVSGR